MPNHKGPLYSTSKWKGYNVLVHARIILLCFKCFLWSTVTPKTPIIYMSLYKIERKKKTQVAFVRINFRKPQMHLITIIIIFLYSLRRFIMFCHCFLNDPYPVTCHQNICFHNSMKYCEKKQMTQGFEIVSLSTASSPAHSLIVII